MKTLQKIVLSTVALFTATAAYAGHAHTNVSGKWAGTAFANAAFDLNGDGVFARTFVFNAYDQGKFKTIEGVADTDLVSLGTCDGPGSLELTPLGTFSFRGDKDDVLFTEVDPAAPNLCFSAANPNEVLQIHVIGGRGKYAGATGTGTLTIHDIALITRPVTLPGFPPLPAPLMIDSQGEFTLTIQQ